MSTVTPGTRTVTGRRPFTKDQISQRFRRLNIQPLAEDLDPNLQTPFTAHPDECTCNACDQNEDYRLGKALDLLKQTVRSEIYASGIQSLANHFPQEWLNQWLEADRPNKPGVREKDKHQLSNSIQAFKHYIDNLLTASPNLPDSTREVLSRPKNRAILRNILAKWPQLEPTVTQLLLLSGFWVRPIADWNLMPGDNEKKSLIDHLLVLYPAPMWMYEEWSERNPSPTSTKILLFLTVVQGGSLEITAQALGWQVPKAYYYFLLQAPSNLRFQDAATHAELARLGCKHVTFSYLQQLDLDQLNPFSSDWTQDVYRFLSDFVVWLDKQWTTIQNHERQDITAYFMNLLERSAFQFQWVGRSPRRVFAEYQDFLQKFSPEMAFQWLKLGWDWKCTDAEGIEWQIEELNRGMELYLEGKSMGHCVAGYARECNNGRDHIFSLKKNGERCLTIQVRNNMMVQELGKYNRQPHEAERAILNRWYHEMRPSQ